MKMWSMKVIILLLFCYACLATDSKNVVFESRNFYNVLHWKPAEPAFPGEKLLYSVQYRSDVNAQPFVTKKDCNNITALSCDLTPETPSRHDVHYSAKVLVNGRLHGITRRFRPLAHTILGPPTLSNYTTVSSLHVNVTLPLGPNKVPLLDIISGSKIGPLKTIMVYVLKITHPAWAAQVHKNTNGRFMIALKNNRTQFCGYVVYKPSSDWGRSESEKTHFCAKLTDDHLMHLPWLLVSAALVIALIVIIVISLCYYVSGGKKKTMPKQLTTSFSTQPRIIKNLDGNLNISKPEFCTQSDKTVYATIQVKPQVPSDGTGYSPQDMPSSTQSSGTYGVVAVHVPAEKTAAAEQETTRDEEDRNLAVFSKEEIRDMGGIGPALTTQAVPPLPNLDSYESRAAMPILLQTVRDPNGQLTLPSLTLQLESRTVEKERKLLLSDLIEQNKEGTMLESFQSFGSSDWSDSGCDESIVCTPTQPYCNTSYFLSKQVDPYIQQVCSSTPLSDETSGSGYKQNWLPETILGLASKESCSYRRVDDPWTWTHDKMEEESEEDPEQDIEEGSREILLGLWGLKVQE